MTTTISIDNLKNHPRNIRKTYGDLKELTASIKEKGVLQNLVVVPDPKNEGKYLVVAGNCRLRAAKKAGLTELECVIAEMSEQEQVLTMLVENMQRNGLSIAEEAAGIQMCLEDFGMKVADVAKATDGIGEIANGIERINEVASNNAATTQEQSSSITEILGLSNQIVTESDKLRAETENITNISENLNRYSDEINSDLSQYNV